MVTLLITSVLLLGLVAIALYFWQKPSSESQQSALPPVNARGLFETTPAPEPNNGADEELLAAVRRRAQQGDKTTLQEAMQLNRKIYDEVLDTFVVDAGDGPRLLSLVSHVTRYELPVNKNLADAFMRSWQSTPDRVSTAKMLHIAALTDQSDVYREAVELALRFWREGKVPNLSATEFQALLTGEFWVLSSGTRSSGAGFMLKRTLSSARRELEAKH